MVSTGKPHRGWEEDLFYRERGRALLLEGKGRAHK